MTVRALVDRWNAYWFPRTSTVPLAAARILAVAAQLFWFMHDLSYHLELVERNPGFVSPQLIIRAIAALTPENTVFTPSGLTLIYTLTRIAGALALVGLGTRLALFCFAAGTTFFIAHGYSYGDVHHTEAIFVMFLFALAFAPSGASWSVDAVLRRRRGKTASSASSDLAIWPLKFVHLMLSLTYFSTGISKLIRGGLQWMNGYTLQGYTFADALTRNIPLGLWLAQQHELAIVLSIGTVFFELFYFVSMLVPWTAPFWFLGAIAFHFGLYLTAGHPFFQHITLNFILLLFLTPPWWRAWLGQFLPRLPTWTAPAQQAG